MQTVLPFAVVLVAVIVGSLKVWYDLHVIHKIVNARTDNLIKEVSGLREKIGGLENALLESKGRER